MLTQQRRPRDSNFRGRSRSLLARTVLGAQRGPDPKGFDGDENYLDKLWPSTTRNQCRSTLSASMLWVEWNRRLADADTRRGSKTGGRSWPIPRMRTAARQC